MTQLAFKHVYDTFSCVFKKDLPILIYNSERATRELSKDYEMPSVELVSIQKVGLFKYLVVWKVSGYLKDV